MKFSQLRTIIQVAELGSLSKAADRLHIAQPALSRQVRMLEAELGVQLFQRHGRGMVITESGQDVLRHAYRVIGEVQELRVCVADSGASLRGHVSIGMPPTVADILTVPLVTAFQEHHPEATLRIVGAYSGYILDWLHRGEIDVAILFESKSARSLRSTPLLEESLNLIGSADAGLSPDQPVEFDTLQSRKLLLPSAGHSLRTLLDECTRGLDITLNVQVETDSYTVLKDLVRAKQGMTILPLAPIYDEISAGSLTYAPLLNPIPKRRLMMSYPTDRPTARLAQFAGDVLFATVTDLVKRQVWAGRLI
ncbi:MAG: LysR family transcriptional regulator [Blastopirellula sp.]|nr:MAG: LysR family transcriptional regulator [Blastopirellula sp.]